jgi:hypothetical protein
VTCAEKLDRSRHRKEAERKRSDKHATKHSHHGHTWAAGETRGDRHRSSGARRPNDTAQWEADEPPNKVEREWGAAATMRQEPKRGGKNGQTGHDYLDRDLIDGDARGEHGPGTEVKSLLTTAGQASAVFSGVL